MSTTIETPTSEDLSQTLRTAKLEQAYAKALQQAEHIYAEEQARVLRVQLLLLEDENDALQDRIAEDNVQLDRMEDGNRELRQEVNELEASLQITRADLNCRVRDVERYKAEAESMSVASSEVSRILKEKLALTRELAALKPELEHFQSQAATQQNVLAEKLSLQREVSALQVELETEKRAVQRIKATTMSAGSDPSISAELEELRKELAKERREVQKSEREARKKTVEWETQKDALEGKLDAFRNKLRSTKEQLKEAQDELERTQAAHFAKSADLAALRATGANPRKRNVAHFDPDMTIGTPGHGAGRPASKRARTTKVASEEPPKPAFSITPFLNRTLSILPESPSEVDANLTQHIDKIAAEAEQSTLASAPAKETEKSKAVQEKLLVENAKTAKKSGALQATQTKTRKPMKETTNAKVNLVVQKPRLAKVAEEEEDEENAPTLEPPDLGSDQPPKRQKVLGQKKRIFDGGESEPEKPKIRKLGGGLRGGGSSGFGDLSFMSGGAKALTAFSPLKKDRRAAAGA